MLSISRTDVGVNQSLNTWSRTPVFKLVAYLCQTRTLALWKEKY